VKLLQKTLLSKHGPAAGVGLIALVLLSMSSTGPALLNSLRGNVVDIGIEHDKPLSLSLEVGILNDKASVEFFSESAETILISVPSTWVRREVKNAPIHTVTSESPSLGFTRWKLPARAGISFRVPDAPDSIVLHNPSGVQMKLDLVQVDLETEEVKRDILLIQGDTVKLW
jgi:hypothetical protein